MTSGFLGILGRACAGDARAQIEELEADANHSWWPTDAQLSVLGAALLKRTPSPDHRAELRAAVFKLGNSLRGQ